MTGPVCPRASHVTAARPPQPQKNALGVSTVANLAVPVSPSRPRHGGRRFHQVPISLSASKSSGENSIGRRPAFNPTKFLLRLREAETLIPLRKLPRPSSTLPLPPCPCSPPTWFTSFLSAGSVAEALH